MLSFAVLLGCTGPSPDVGTDTECVRRTWYADRDSDTYGDGGAPFEGCAAPTGFVADPTDCDDANGAVHPGAVEACNEVDDDCSGAIDEGFDVDGDGAWSQACAGGTDCDDGDAERHPEVEHEACEDGIDQDCSGSDRMCGFDTTIELAGVTTLHGEAGADAGRQLKVGDVDDDGVDDLLVAALFAADGAGGGWVYPGGAIVSGDLAALGWRITGDLDSFGAGRAIGVGDVDGDGVGDLGFGAPFASECGMRILPGPIDGDRSVSDGSWLVAPAGSFAGHGADLGDLDGDGIADAVVGAYAGWDWKGGAYVAYGPLRGDVDLSSEATQIVGDGGYVGRWIRASGDYDGDGMSDVLLAAPYGAFAAPRGGALYMVRGPPPGDLDLSLAFDARYVGVNPGETAGLGLGAGDVDGDGRDDVLMATGEGVAHVYLGPADGDRDTTTSDIRVVGLGASVVGADLIAADVNADGDGELVVAGPDSVPGVWLFADLAGGTYTTADAMVFMPGALETGGAVQVGDLDADGLLEVLVGAPAEATNGVGAGAVHVVEYAE